MFWAYRKLRVTEHDVFKEPQVDQRVVDLSLDCKANEW